MSQCDEIRKLTGSSSNQNKNINLNRFLSVSNLYLKDLFPSDSVGDFGMYMPPGSDVIVDWAETSPFAMLPVHGIDNKFWSSLPFGDSRSTIIRFSFRLNIGSFFCDVWLWFGSKIIQYTNIYFAWIVVFFLHKITNKTIDLFWIVFRFRCLLVTLFWYFWDFY